MILITNFRKINAIGMLNHMLTGLKTYRTTLFETVDLNVFNRCSYGIMIKSVYTQEKYYDTKR